MYDFDKNEFVSQQLQIYNQNTIIKAQRANRRYGQRLLWFFLFTLVASSWYLLEKRSPSISLENALWALGITWLGFLPSIQYLLDQNRPPMPFFPLVGIFYATSFGLPIFADDLVISSRWSLANVSSTALILVFIGLTGMNIAFFGSKYLLWRRMTPFRLSSYFSLSKLLTLLWLFLLSHIVFLYLPFIRQIPSITHFLEPIGYVAYGMFYIIWSRGKLPVIQVWLLLGLFVPLEIVSRLTSGALAQLMLLGLFVVIVIWYERKRLPLILIMLTVIFFIVFNPVKGDYRYLTWGFGRYSNINPIEKVTLFVNLAIEHYQKNNNNSEVSVVESSTGSAISRTAHIIVFSEVIKDTPTKVPYWNGESYLPLLTSYIPRIIWPDKPIERTGNDFGRRYRYLGSNDFTTSFNLPWIVEMYANFGVFGVLMGMPLVGLILGFLDQKLNHPQMNFLEFVVGATILFRLFYQESNFSLMFGTVLTLFLSLYIIFKLFLGNKYQS